MVLDAFEISEDQVDQIVLASLRRERSTIRDKRFREITPDWKELSTAFKVVLDYYGGPNAHKR